MSNRGIALAAMYQSAGLVNLLANSQKIEDNDMACLIESVFHFQYNDLKDIYPSGCLQTGKRFARQSLKYSENLHLTGYVLSMVQLQKKLAQNGDMEKTLEQTLPELAQLLTETSIHHLDFLEKLGNLYQQTISQLTPRIMVQGNPQALQQTRTVARIRSLLMAGIRAAYLWNQNGGNRWLLLFQRKKLLEEISI